MAKDLQNQMNGAFPETIKKTGEEGYEYGSTREDERGLFGAVVNIFNPVRRQVLKPEETTYTQADMQPSGVYDKKYVAAQYGDAEYDINYMPLVRGSKQAYQYAKSLFTSSEARDQAVEAAKAAPAAVGEMLENQMEAGLAMAEGYESLVTPQGEEIVYDPLLVTGPLAPAGVAAIRAANTGDVVLGIFGGSRGNSYRNRQQKYVAEKQKVEQNNEILDDVAESLFQRTGGYFVGEDGIGRYEIPTKDAQLLPYFKNRNFVDPNEDSDFARKFAHMNTKKYDEQAVYGMDQFSNGTKDLTLADVLKFDDLYREYPDLKNYRVQPLSMKDIDRGVLGSYDPKTLTFSIKPSTEQDMVRTLLHEVQHAVDHLEYRQYGANSNQYLDKNIKAHFESVDNQFKAEKNNFFAFLIDQENYREPTAIPLTPDELTILKDTQMQDAMMYLYTNPEKLDELKSLPKDTRLGSVARFANIVSNKLDEYEQKALLKVIQLHKQKDKAEKALNEARKEAFDKYQRTPGEVDARNVETRFDAPETQLTTLPSKTADMEKDMSLDGMGDTSFKAENRQISNTDYDSVFSKLDEIETPEDWQAAAKKLVSEERDITGKSVVRRTPELEESARNLIDDKLITREQHLENVAKNKPITEWTDLPRQPSSKAAVFALKPSQREQGLFLLSSEDAAKLGVKQTTLKEGDLFNGRLDIPAYQNYDTWVVAGTSPAVKSADGKGVTTYAKAIHYTSGDGKPVRFIASEKRSQEIGTGREGKTGYATISGRYKATSEEDLRKLAETYLNDPEWSQVGFDPRRLGTFYLRKPTGDYDVGSVVKEADEVIQIGPLVLARNVKIDPDYQGYRKGGLV